jgi:SagB-type dehydrogenase family enzyme
MKTRKSKELIVALDSGLYGAKNFGESLALIFNENVKFDKFLIHKQVECIQSFSNKYVHQRSCQPYKVFPTCKEYDFKPYLKGIPDGEKTNLFKILACRRSGRFYSPYSISINELALLCHYSYGITGESYSADTEALLRFRTVPSAGALYPLELYVYLNTSMLPHGVYHYSPNKSALELVKEEDYMEYLRENLVAEPFVDLQHCSCVFFITSFFERVLIKYGDRGYRFILQEVGFLTHNISLLAEFLGLCSCVLGSYVDDNINQILAADGIFETVQNVIVIGKNKEVQNDNITSK